MKMKRVLSLVMALFIAIGVLVGCGDGNADYASADISAFVDNGEKMSISWLGYATLAGCTEGKPSELLIEDKFNIDITPIFAESSGYTDKKNALLQSGEIPDLIYELDPMHVFADARDEYLLEVPYEAIKKYAPSLFESLIEKAPSVWQYSYYNGKNYGLPNINHGHMESRTTLFRADWLEKLGMEVPETVDELHDVLYAFVHNDPDGNGKDDTYGYALAGTHFQHYFSDIFGAYGVLPFDWQEVDGEIVYGGLRPETEEVLGILAQWYKEGLIYPGFIEVDKTAGSLLLSNMSGFSPYASYEDPDSPTNAENTLKEKVPEGELVYAKLVKGPDGLSGARGWGYPCHVVSFGDNGEDSPAKTTRILSIFEKIYNDEELLKEIRLGKEGETYTIDDVSKTTNIFVATENYSETAQKRLAGYEFALASPTFWTPFAPEEGIYNKYLSDSYKEFKNKYQSKDAVLTDAFYKVDIVPSAPTYIEDLMNSQMSLMSSVIMGDVDSDKYLEEFTKIWEATGGPQMLSEAQNQQNIVNEIYGKLGIKK